jgi:hypothetical protein
MLIGLTNDEIVFSYRRRKLTKIRQSPRRAAAIIPSTKSLAVCFYNEHPGKATAHAKSGGLHLKKQWFYLFFRGFALRDC